MVSGIAGFAVGLIGLGLHKLLGIDAIKDRLEALEKFQARIEKDRH